MPRRPFAPVGWSWLVVVTAGSGPAAWAAKKKSSTTTTTLSPRETRVRELRALVGEASAQEAVLLTEIADIEARLDDLDEAVWDLTKQTTAAQRRLDAAERTLQKAEADQDVALRRLGAVQAQVDASRQQMNQTVAAMYQRGTSEEQAVYVALVEGAANANDLFSAQRYVSGTIKSDRRELDHFVALKEDADRLRHEVEARAEEMRVIRDQQAAERDRLAGLKNEALANRAAARVGGGPPAGPARRGPGQEVRLPVGAQRPPGRVGRRRRVPPPGPGRSEARPPQEAHLQAAGGRPDEQRVRHPGAPHPR